MPHSSTPRPRKSSGSRGDFLPLEMEEVVEHQNGISYSDDESNVSMLDDYEEDDATDVVPLVGEHDGDRFFGGDERIVDAERRAMCWPVYLVVALCLLLLIAGVVFVPPAATTVPAQQLHHCDAILNGTESWEAFRLDVATWSSEERCNPVDIRGAGRACSCQNPTKPAARTNMPNWQVAADLNLDHIQEAPAKLDVVILGDSLVEHWWGLTFGHADSRFQGNVDVYRSLFSKQNGANVQGLALGISADRSVHLLHRLRTGEMDESLQPSVWWIVIGTNDYGDALCRPEVVITGQITIAEEIRKRRPDATVVLNSLLPRGDEQKLLWWKDYSFINRALQCYADSTDHVEFFNATQLFLNAQNTVNSTLLPDGLHPTVVGSWKWGRAIVSRVLRLLENRR